MTCRNACSSFVLGDAARAVQVDIERERLRDADRIGELDHATLGRAAATTFLAR